MGTLKKEQVISIMDNVINGLKPENFSNKYEYYASLYPAEATEADLASAVRRFPALHSQMEKLVRSIISLIQKGLAFSIWINDEEQAGCLLSYALAYYDVKYCALFAQSLLYQDMDHEVNQNDYVLKLFKKWGARMETARLAEARQTNPGQSGYDIVSYLFEKYEELHDYLEEKSGGYYHDENEGDYDADDEDENYEEITGNILQIQDKSTLEQMSVIFDDKDDRIVVNHDFFKNAAYKLGSVLQVKALIEELKEECTNQNLAYKIAEGATVKETIEAYLLDEEKLTAPILSFFTPKGEKSSIDRLNDQYFVGQKLIPCQRYHFFKDLMDIHILVCDEAGKRMMDTTIYEDEFLWKFKTHSEMQEAIKAKIEEYRSLGYELTQKDEPNYAFDYMQKQMKETANTLKKNKELMDEQENLQE